MVSMFWNSATYFSIITVSRSAAALSPLATAGSGTEASSVSRCRRALAVSPVAAYASARISSFSAQLTYGIRAYGGGVRPHTQRLRRVHVVAGLQSVRHPGPFRLQRRHRLIGAGVEDQVPAPRPCADAARELGDRFAQ